MRIEDIYQEVLDGKRYRFPPNTWNGDDSTEMARRITIYLIEEILQWDDSDLKQRWGTPIIVKYRLRGLVKHYMGIALLK